MGGNGATAPPPVWRGGEKNRGHENRDPRAGLLDPVVIPQELPDDLGLRATGPERVLAKRLFHFSIEEEGLAHQEPVCADRGLATARTARIFRGRIAVVSLRCHALSVPKLPDALIARTMCGDYAADSSLSTRHG